MRNAILLPALAASVLAVAQPAIAGPGFAYSWLTTDKTFEQCKLAASSMVEGLNYPHIQQTRFGVTGEKDDETLYVNCEDLRHVAVLLVRPARPRVGEIDAFVSLLQHKLEQVAR